MNEYFKAYCQLTKRGNEYEDNWDYLGVSGPADEQKEIYFDVYIADRDKYSTVYLSLEDAMRLRDHLKDVIREALARPNPEENT